MTQGTVYNVNDKFKRKLDDAESLLQGNLAMVIDQNTGIVKKASNGDIVYALNYKSTLDPIADTVGVEKFLTGAELEDQEIALHKDGIVKMPVGAGVGILYGTDICVDSEGKIRKEIPLTPPDQESHIGISEELWTNQTEIKVRLQI